MRVLHVVKTSEGAGWASQQVAELVRRGVEIHVALPSMTGMQISAWRSSGAVLHEIPLDFPRYSPWKLGEVKRRARMLVGEIRPDLIHSHFVGTTSVLRLSLGKQHPIPRLYQVAGPLHLEHSIYRTWELATAGPADYWIASSNYTRSLYESAGIQRDRLFLSYYGARTKTFSSERKGVLREKLRIRDDMLIVGNISYMYPPKYYLGQTVGLKCHEDIIDALGEVTRRRPDVVGVLVGGPWGGALSYEERLRKRAWAVGRDRIRMTGFMPSHEVSLAWPDFDLAIHVPLSENCGGVVEPLLAEVPVIAARTGGLPEVVIDGVTGITVPKRDPDNLANVICDELDDLPRLRSLASRGQRLVRRMFDVKRTSAEIYEIYRHVLDRNHFRPDEFSSKDFADFLCVNE